MLLDVKLKENTPIAVLYCDSNQGIRFIEQYIQLISSPKELWCVILCD